MLKPRFTGPFKRERRLMQKRGKDIHKLTEVMGLIINEQPLPPERCNHPLHGEWKDTLGCHIQGDWWFKIRILADFEPWSFACSKTPPKTWQQRHPCREIDPAAHTVTFHRTGSHSDLF